MSASFSQSPGKAARASWKCNRVRAVETWPRERTTNSCTGRRHREMRLMDAPYDIDMIGRSGAEDAIPPGLVEGFHEFHRQHVSYCYWKSSRRIHEVLAGAGDVDLLVARTDQ